MALEKRRGYHPDHPSFAKFLLSEQSRGPAMEAANDIANIARETAPRDKDADSNKVSFWNSFKAQKQPTPWVNTGTGAPNPRAIAVVVNDAPHAAAVEFGNRRTPRAHRTLGKAGARIGEFRSKTRGLT